jgi:hypothetical protein
MRELTRAAEQAQPNGGIRGVAGRKTGRVRWGWGQPRWVRQPWWLFWPEETGILFGTIPVGQMRGVHLVAAYPPKRGVVLAQLAVDKKANEMVSMPQLLAQLDLIEMMGSRVSTGRCRLSWALTITRTEWGI